MINWEGGIEICRNLSIVDVTNLDANTLTITLLKV